jgi:hypothetical protein
MEMPENFVERFARLELLVTEVWEITTGEGCANHRILSSRVTGIWTTGAIVVTGLVGWLTWITLQFT